MKREIFILIIVILTLTTISANMETQIITHRTNSIEEIEQAIKTSENPFVEIDVRKQDNQFIASHDKNPENITTIKKILEKFKKQTKFDFDLKEQGWEIEFTELLLQYLKPNQFIISSQYVESLKKIKNKTPEIQLGLVILKKGPLSFKKNWLKSRLKPESFIKLAKENNFYIIPDHRFINNNLLKTAEKNNIQIIPWTVNCKSKIEKLSKEKQIPMIISS